MKVVLSRDVIRGQWRLFGIMDHGDFLRRVHDIEICERDKAHFTFRKALHFDRKHVYFFVSNRSNKIYSLERLKKIKKKKPTMLQMIEIDSLRLSQINMPPQPHANYIEFNWLSH